MDGSLPRVLFVSVNPFSATSNNGKTFASFFEGYPTEALAQLYFHRELPSSPVCANYFRITDEDILGHIARPRRVVGERVSSVSISSSPIPKRAHAALKGSRTARLLRQLLWARVPFTNPELLAWLDDFAPEVVFFCGGDAAALYPKITTLADRYKARMVFYITDDYVLPISSGNVSARVLRRWTRIVFRRLATRADLVLTIGDFMSRRYQEEFGFDSTPIMNMVDVPRVQPGYGATVAKPGEPMKLVYAGSLHSNRWRVLAALAESIARLGDQGIPVRLRIFGPEPEAEARRAVEVPPFVEYGGLLSPEELSHAIGDADVLVHVEADDPESMSVTALSVSTKIPEYLASGRSVLAIGPRGLASIEYLAAHDVATVVEPRDDKGLDRALKALATQPQLRVDLAGRAFQLARAQHASDRVRRMLWDRLKCMTG